MGGPTALRCCRSDQFGQSDSSRRFSWSLMLLIVYRFDQVIENSARPARVGWCATLGSEPKWLRIQQIDEACGGLGVGGSSPLSPTKFVVRFFKTQLNTT